MMYANYKNLGSVFSCFEDALLFEFVRYFFGSKCHTDILIFIFIFFTDILIFINNIF